jgi:hypothetical protein
MKSLIRRGAPLFLALVLVLAGIDHPQAWAAGGPNAVLSWPDVEGFTGDRIRVTLTIADPDSIQAALIDVKYDPGLVAPVATSVQREAYGLTVQASWGASTPADSTLRFVFATADPDGYVGSGGAWVSIEFDLIDSGLNPLRFSDITLERLPNTVLPAVGVDGSIGITPAAVLPSTWGQVKDLYRSD